MVVCMRRLRVSIRNIPRLALSLSTSCGDQLTGITLTNALAFGCRQSNMHHLPALLQKLEEVSEHGGGAKVDVITHSMGGILFKLFLAKYPAEFARLVRSWVAIAAPFNGAPGFAADAFITGDILPRTFLWHTCPAQCRNPKPHWRSCNCFLSEGPHDQLTTCVTARQAFSLFLGWQTTSLCSARQCGKWFARRRRSLSSCRRKALRGERGRGSPGEQRALPDSSQTL